LESREESLKGRVFTSWRRNSFLAALALALFLSAYSFADAGASTFKAHCASCHGSKGAADTMLGRNLNLRPLASPEVQEQSDDELFSIISRGRKKRMPAYDNRLSKEQIRELVKYIRSLKQ
jgi:mono/diheme cytochrome c family protein